MQLVRLPTGVSEKRLLNGEFQKIHDGAGRIKDMAYNLLGALRVSSKKDKFVPIWLDKSDILHAVKQKISEAESMFLLASGAAGGSFPVVSSLEAVQASNKGTSEAQKERRPQDIKIQPKKRKIGAMSRGKLHTVQTPLVEANRPNKKRKSEASRHQKNYQAAARKSKLPKSLNPSIKKILDDED